MERQQSTNQKIPRCREFRRIRYEKTALNQSEDTPLPGISANELLMETFSRPREG